MYRKFMSKKGRIDKVLGLRSVSSPGTGTRPGG